MRAAATGPLLIVLLLCPLPRAASGATLIEQDRGVYASATASEPAESDFQDAADEASDFTPQAPDVGAEAATTNVLTATRARLTSQVDGPSIQAIGSTEASGDSHAVGAAGDAPSDSFFELIFEASETNQFDLAGMVSAAADLGDAYASVELVDLDAESQLASHEASPGEDTTFGDSVFLFAGTRYRLTAFALSRSEPADGAGGTADATFVVSLAVPEPSTSLLHASGLAGLLGLSRARRRGRRGGGPRGPA